MTQLSPQGALAGQPPHVLQTGFDINLWPRPGIGLLQPQPLLHDVPLVVLNVAFLRLVRESFEASQKRLEHYPYEGIKPLLPNPLAHPAQRPIQSLGGSLLHQLPPSLGQVSRFRIYEPLRLFVPLFHYRSDEPPDGL